MFNPILTNFTVRTNSEFNLQADLYSELKTILKNSEYSVFGEVRILTKQKLRSGARRILGRLDLAICKGGELLLAIEVKNDKKRVRGWKKQKNKYLSLGVPKLFLCKGFKQIDSCIKEIKRFLNL